MTDKDILSSLLQFGFLTGSRAFGTANGNSDYDIVFPIYYSDKIDAIIKDIPRVSSNYFAGYYIHTSDKQINLIPVHPHEFFPWFLATRAFIYTFKESGITNSIDKYSVFMGMVSLFKATVPKLGKFKDYIELNDRLIHG